MHLDIWKRQRAGKDSLPEYILHWSMRLDGLSDRIWKSYWRILADCMYNDTVCVYAFVKVVLENIRSVMSDVKHTHYFSDSSAAQY